MEKIKLIINGVMAISLLVIAIAVISKAITTKSWKYNTSNTLNGEWIGDYPTRLQCMEDEFIAYEISFRKDKYSKYKTACRYR